MATPPRPAEVTMPVWLAERLFSCYYGVGPRANEDPHHVPLPEIIPQPPTQPFTQPSTQPFTAPTPTPTRTAHDTPPPGVQTIPPNLHSQPPMIDGLAVGGVLRPRGAASRRPT